MAPEVITSGRCTVASDVWPFGIMLWELYHGRPPWRASRDEGQGGGPREGGRGPSNAELHFAPHCPAQYVYLVRACMAQDPAQRPTFKSIVAFLKGLLGMEAQGQEQGQGQ